MTRGFRSATHRRLTAIVALIGTAPIGSGCFAYATVADCAPFPEQGVRIRAHLSAPDRVRLTNITAENVVRVDGDVIEWERQQLRVSAFWLRSSGGIEHRGVGESVTIERSRIVSLEKKTVSVARTGAFAGLIVALGLIARAAFGGISGGGQPPGPPPPAQ